MAFKIILEILKYYPRFIETKNLPSLTIGTANLSIEKSLEDKEKREINI